MDVIAHGFTPESPVAASPSDAERSGPEEGIALCLSGGGYRAMLFHLGTVLRLHATGHLDRVDRVSSVSGGSITAGVLALWMAERERGSSTSIEQGVVAPLRALASRTLDRGAILRGLLLPGSVSAKVAKAYRQHLFGEATLQDLPEGTRFVFNATNVQSGVLWRFSRPYMADWRVGLVKEPGLQLALAVAASSAFPPVLSPVELRLGDADFEPDSGGGLQRPPFTTRPQLTDGGVYDNLGLETAWKRYRTILVSDAGGKMQVEGRPDRDWLRHTLRVLDLIDNQVRSLRKRQLIGSYQSGTRLGAYWGISSDLAKYGLGDTLPCPRDRVLELAATPTRLKKLDARRQERLINWGYAVCDAGLRKHVDGELAAPTAFPFPDSPV